MVSRGCFNSNCYLLTGVDVGKKYLKSIEGKLRGVWKVDIKAEGDKGKGSIEIKNYHGGDATVGNDYDKIYDFLSQFSAYGKLDLSIAAANTATIGHGDGYGNHVSEIALIVPPLKEGGISWELEFPLDDDYKGEDIEIEYFRSMDSGGCPIFGPNSIFSTYRTEGKTVHILKLKRDDPFFCDKRKITMPSKSGEDAKGVSEYLSFYTDKDEDYRLFNPEKYYGFDGNRMIELFGIRNAMDIEGGRSKIFKCVLENGIDYKELAQSFERKVYGLKDIISTENARFFHSPDVDFPKNLRLVADGNYKGDIEKFFQYFYRDEMINYLLFYNGQGAYTPAGFFSEFSDA